MSHKVKFFAALSIAMPIAASAQFIKWDDINTKPPVSSITPIFSQLLITPIPRGFQMAVANASGTSYIHELVPTGENVNQWTQMLTVTGEKDAALNPELTPPKMASLMASGFHNSCPNAFGSYVFPPIKSMGMTPFQSSSVVVRHHRPRRQEEAAKQH